MRVVIPMSGKGSRFLRAGYSKPKPLIEVLGKPMIEWVVSMFPGATDFTFICREDHLRDTELREVLNRVAPQGKILSISPHKLGPVHALLKSVEYLSQSGPSDSSYMVSYCDYYMHWDFADFEKVMLHGAFDGAVPCYSGFHPHLIPAKNLYAGCRVDQERNLLEIKEKYSFEEDKKKGFHSPGAYYFQTLSTLEKYCQRLVDQDLHLGGEYYVSMVYEGLLKDQLKVHVYDKISHFCQWGTPEDLNEFDFWIKRAKELT